MTLAQWEIKVGDRVRRKAGTGDNEGVFEGDEFVVGDVENKYGIIWIAPLGSEDLDHDFANYEIIERSINLSACAKLDFRDADDDEGPQPPEAPPLADTYEVLATEAAAVIPHLDDAVADLNDLLECPWDIKAEAISMLIHEFAEGLTPDMDAEWFYREGKLDIANGLLKLARSSAMVRAAEKIKVL